MANAAMLTQWVEWLEDPNNKQCRGTLHNGKGYCCLGGLARTMGYQFEKRTDASSPQSGYWAMNYRRDGNDLSYFTFLPQDLWDKLDIVEDQAIYTNMNDTDRKSFPEIAAYIRRFYLT